MTSPTSIVILVHCRRDRSRDGPEASVVGVGPDESLLMPESRDGSSSNSSREVLRGESARERELRNRKMRGRNPVDNRRARGVILRLLLLARRGRRERLADILDNMVDD